MKISKYVHKYIKRGYAIYYHSLRMQVIILSISDSNELENAIKEERIPKLKEDTLNILKEYKILVESDKEIEEKIINLRNNWPEPYISLAYFVLTEQCNLACKYCFLGNSDISATKVTNYPMSKKSAKKALEYFSKQTMKDMNQFNDRKEIIFYGGEPLVNFNTLKYVVDESKKMQNKGLLSQDLHFLMVTNGLLLNDEIIKFLIEEKIGVSISVDGADSEKNKLRVDRAGNPIFEKLYSKLLLAKRLGLKYGLSVTLSEETIKDMDSFIKMITELGVDSVCFNLLLRTKDYKVDEEYYKNATQYIIDFYEKTSKNNIYEERFARKLNAFVQSKNYFSDCAATSGSQIVITPDGQVGICHGTMENREFFVGNIDNNETISDNETFKNWSKLSPIFKEKCQECPALGICGGGCPVNASKSSVNASINSIDESFCIHTKIILDYLLDELIKRELELRE